MRVFAIALFLAISYAQTEQIEPAEQGDGTELPEIIEQPEPAEQGDTIDRPELDDLHDTVDKPDAPEHLDDLHDTVDKPDKPDKPEGKEIPEGTEKPEETEKPDVKIEDETISLTITVQGVTDSNKELVCNIIAKALGGISIYCSLTAPRSISPMRRHLQGSKTLFMDASVADPKAAETQATSSSFPSSLTGLPAGTKVSGVTMSSDTGSGNPSVSCDKLSHADCNKRTDCFLEKDECKRKDDLIAATICERLHPQDCRKRTDCFLEKDECKRIEAEDLIHGAACDKLHPAGCRKRRDCFLEKNECKQADHEAEDLIHHGPTTHLPCDNLHPVDCRNRRDCHLEGSECKEGDHEAEDLIHHGPTPIAPGPQPPAPMMIPQCKYLTPDQCMKTKECVLRKEFECELLEIYEDAAEGKFPPSIIADGEQGNLSPLTKCEDLFPNQCARRPDCMWNYEECEKNKMWKNMSPAAQAAAMAAAAAAGGPSGTTKPGTTQKPGTNNGGASPNPAPVSCYSLDPTKCKAQGNCFWDGIGCADIGGALFQVCAKKPQQDCNMTPYCMWNGVGCQEAESEVEMELKCEAILNPQDCNKNMQCTFDFSERECLSKKEYVAEFELICEGRPHAHCKGACYWKKNKCVEHEPMEWEELCPLRPQPACNGLCTWNPAKHQCLRNKVKSKDLAKHQCYSILDEKKCYHAGVCLWLSQKCFPADEFNLAKTHKAELNDKSSTGTYTAVLACAAFFGSCMFGWFMASSFAKKSSRLEDTLLEELYV